MSLPARQRVARIRPYKHIATACPRRSAGVGSAYGRWLLGCPRTVCINSPTMRREVMVVTVSVASIEVDSRRARLISLTGEFDLNNIPEFQSALDEAFGDGEAAIVVDLREVSFLDSTMLQALARANERARSYERTFVLIRPRPVVWRVFEVSGLDRVMTSFGSREELESLGTSGGDPAAA